MSTQVLSKASIIAWLKYNPRLIVTFTKADETERVMACTLMTGIIPHRARVSPDAWSLRKHGADKETISVFDLDKKDWRSFRVASVKMIEIPPAIVGTGRPIILTNQTLVPRTSAGTHLSGIFQWLDGSTLSPGHP